MSKRPLVLLTDPKLKCLEITTECGWIPMLAPRRPAAWKLSKDPKRNVLRDFTIRWRKEPE